MASNKVDDYRYTYWDTCTARDSPARCVRGLTYAELQQRINAPDSLRGRIDADVWPPALEWGGYIIEREDDEDAADS
jgi:hypothetical protein